MKNLTLLSKRAVASILLGCLWVLIAPVVSSRADTIQFEQKPWEALANHDVGEEGNIALAIRPAAWLHGETPNWILHYRRITEAKRVALEIDFHIVFVAKALGATPDQIAHKANVFIFEDDKDWKEFMSKVTAVSPVSPWAASFAHGQDLFLNVRNGQTGTFDSSTLAHETTHAVVARVYPNKRCPLWLNEGFAEAMSGESVGARMGQYNQRLLQRFNAALLSPEQLVAMESYPTEMTAVWQLYQSAEKLVRFIRTDAPKEKFPELFKALVNGEPLTVALPRIYADKYPTYDVFKQRFARMAR